MKSLDEFLNDLASDKAEVADDGYVGNREYEVAWENDEGRTITTTISTGFGESGALQKMRELLPSDAKEETLRVVREIIESHFGGDDTREERK